MDNTYGLTTPATPMGAMITDFTPDEGPSTLGAMKIEIDTQRDEINRLSSQLETMTRNWQHAKDRLQEVNQQIDNVRGYIVDQYDINGEISEELSDVAEYLCIELTKSVDVTITVTYSGTATVPLGFDVDDLEGELSFSYDEGYSNIEWNLDADSQDWDVQES